ncbi:hypothetical protein CRUP_025654, partial [Coryphaenoides rupestris]
MEQYHGRAFMAATELMRNREKEVIYSASTFYSFNGFDFSYDKSQETTVVFYVKDKETGKKIDSTLNVTLYNCSMGRKDCSLCKNSDSKYSCVWCRHTKSCIYKQAVQGQPRHRLPRPPDHRHYPPLRADKRGDRHPPSWAPTWAFHRGDIKSISVAGLPCAHLPDKYSVLHQ